MQKWFDLAVLTTLAFILVLLLSGCVSITEEDQGLDNGQNYQEWTVTLQKDFSL